MGELGGAERHRKAKLSYIEKPEIDRASAALSDPVEQAVLFAEVNRFNTLYMIMRAGSGHIGTSLSAMDIASWIWLRELENPNQHEAKHSDIYFSSKGHDAPGLYAILIALGKLPSELMHMLRRHDGRDNIALSWLARELDLSYDLFEATMMQRENQARWLAELMEGYELPKGILGVAYKPSSHLTTGSPARLVANLLSEKPYLHDPHAGMGEMPGHPHVWLVGCKHPEFPDYGFPGGSVVIDPWGYIPDQEGVEVVRLGR